MTEYIDDDNYHLDLCTESAYRIARNIYLRSEGQQLERSIVTGVDIGASNLTPEERQQVSTQLLCRLFGRSLQDVAEEESQAVEQEQAEFEKLFYNG